MNEVVQKNLQEHKQALMEFENKTEVIIKIAETITSAFKQGNSLYLCGNGGSAADCQHIAAEFVGRFRKERQPLPAIALTTDTSNLTSISNDYGFSDIFTRQVKGLIKAGDILWAFSTSGTSPNILSAVDAAKAKKAIIIAFTGKKSTELEKKSDLCLSIPCLYTSTAQEIHALAYHTICDMVDQQFA